MTSHDEKILQLLDRIHTTAQSRREKAIDGGVERMERVNRTSYGALRDLTQNGHKKAGKNAVGVWQNQELLVDDDHIVNAPKAPPRQPMAPLMPGAAGQAVEEAAAPEITQVMGHVANAAGEGIEPTGRFSVAEATAVTQVPADTTAIFHPAATEQVPGAPQAPGAREYAAAGRAQISTDDREPTPDEIVSGNGATYGGGAGAVSQQTQVIWFRRLFRRR